ncbi:hypothetical protein MKJ04_05210 [Pontibacter sp. E15-1]|uniref:hypothetical protein n=1 Tax=Pontibacter sp. E15-1 TaxID=2919918 RepID=UPI001F4F4AE2|nr:hypothetical protein [Pontibacter sp. E15-1]MCJ8164232.1 hypothetical protein [Pontibacter sp. E15-1]
MGTSIRWVIRRVKGRVACFFEWDDRITARSVIHITAAEVGFGTTQRRPTPPGQNFFYHLGAASVWVSNISPRKNEFRGSPGSVAFYLHVDWDSPLDVAVTITVEDALPIEIQGY